MATALKEAAPAEASTKPAQSYRLRGVSVSVFENPTKSGDRTFFKVSLQKSYRDGDEWKTTMSLGRDDLPIAALLLKQAWQYILETEGSRDKEALDD